MDLTAERIARNNSTFREANERIRESATGYGVSERVPFVCECAEQACNKVIRMPLSEYEEVRSNATHFLSAPSHDAAEGQSGRVIREHGEYVVIEKVGLAGELATELDPRKAEGA